MKIRLPFRKPGPPLKQPPKLKLKASVARSRRTPLVEEEDFLEEPEPNMRLSHAFVVVLVLHVIAVAGVFAFNSIKARQADILSATRDEPTQTTAVAASSDPAPATIGNSTVPEAMPIEPPKATTTATASITPIKPYTSVSQLTATVAPKTPTDISQPGVPVVSSAKTHELQPGETLTKIAAQYGVTVAALEKANEIADPTKMRAGMMLVIPNGTPVAAKPVPAAIQPSIAAAVTQAPAITKPVTPVSAGIKESGKIYIVEKGDNPVKIAKKLKVSYASLLALNKITDPRKLQIGQKLKIPGTN